MKILLSSLLAVSCINCSKFHSVKSPDVDSAFESYLEQYIQVKEREMGFSHTSTPSIEFKSLRGSIIGVCYWYFDGKREIFIDPEYWFSSHTTEEDRRLLIFHEMGHCDLDRGHTGPSSIMEVYHIGGSFYKKHQYYFDKELFGTVERKNISSSIFNKSHEHSNCGGVVVKDSN